MLAHSHEHSNQLSIPSDFVSKIEYSPSYVMPPRMGAIRRCAFKLPKNDKYQCQKVGDKYQPIVKLWYCRLHDRHAQDRCQVLIEWAGKGAQCEQLGTLNKSCGKKLCEWHVMQSRKDDWLEGKDVVATKRRDSTQESVEHEVERRDAAVPCISKRYELAPPSSLPPDETEHTGDQAPLAETGLHHPSNNVDRSTDFGSQQQAPAKEDISNASTPLDCRSSGLEVSNREDPPTTTPTAEVVPSCPTPTFTDNTVEESSTSVIEPPSKAAHNLAVTKSPHKPRDPGRAAHTRVDSLEPLSSPRLSGHTAPSTPITAPRAAYQSVTQSFPTTESTQGATPPRQSVHARINFLNALRDWEASTSSRIAAVYVQCCVCLEKHGEYNMREVESCKHRYRDLCLIKATKIRSLRRFNCSSCRTWMEERQKNILSFDAKQKDLQNL